MTFLWLVAKSVISLIENEIPQIFPDLEKNKIFLTFFLIMEILKVPNLVKAQWITLKHSKCDNM